MQYTYDPAAAEAADNGVGGQYISETGAYAGKIVKATGKKTSKGGDQITLAFATDSGQVSDYLTLQICDKEGKPHFGHGILMSILRCASVRTIAPTPLAGGKAGEVEFKALEGKPVGLLLQAAEYQKQDGSIANKMEVVCAFDAKTRKVASELDKNLPATQLEKRISMLEPVRKIKNPRPAPAASSHGPAPTSDDFGDDINF